MEHTRPKTDTLPPADLIANRELSLLQFHRRVYELAADEKIPLLERLRFLCIVSSNLDEFFEIRVAGVKQQAELGATPIPPDTMSPRELLQRIAVSARELVGDQYRLLNQELIPALANHGIRFLRRSRWTPAQRAWVKDYFDAQLLPIISPIRLDPAHPFPRILNKALHFIVEIDGTDEFGQAGGMAVVQAPRVLPRIIRLPDAGDGSYDFVFLSSIIHEHVGDLFPGMQVTGCHQFRVTRNSDLLVDAEEVEDLRKALEGELPSRRYGEVVRLEVAENCPEEVVSLLSRRFELEDSELYRVNGPVNLHRLATLPDLVGRPDLKYPAFTPSYPANITPGADLFEIIRRGDILLHHPYQSFQVVLDFVRQAATDPGVLAIKQTLYRSGQDSAIEGALLSAANAGKVVTAVVELRARFDEEANISIADRLQEAGANVVYGVVGYKTHAKMLMVVRREGNKLRRYVHLGTGNYHPRTARQYSDFGLITCDEIIAEDVHKLFLQLTCPGRETKLTRILQSPFTLHKELLGRISNEAANARAGKPARIIAKINALAEPTVIEELYLASQAGVQIDLIIRGICCLRPGVPGISENIRVRSVVGRFLEHSRVYYFENAGEPEVFCASADWMGRNLLRRVETCYPILDPAHKKTVIEQGLMICLKDNTNAWLLDAEGGYHRLQPNLGEAPFTAQDYLLSVLADPGVIN